MPAQYEPKDHIQHLAIAPRADGILDQREITIQSYQTTIPFDFNAIDAGLERAWLTPVIRFGVFSRSKDTSKSHCTVVLGLQDELSIRAYDYDARRPLWFSWQDAIVETVNIHYFSDEDGLLRFKATGGGRRITDDRLYDFNTTFLHIPKEAVKKRNFDLDKLRKLCFERFSEQLYMLRFADPSGQEYRSIDHALFQSRQYIDPNAERLQEIQADHKVKIESFDSDIEVRAKELAKRIRVRFFIRGLSGSLRLRFPHFRYKKDPGTVEEQLRLFYRLVDITENSILDADYYAHLPRSLDELEIEEGLFPDSVDLAPFRDVLLNAKMMQQFFQTLDLGASWSRWQPHLRAIDELLPTGNIASNIKTLVQALTDRNPRLAARLLTTCLSDAKIHGVGHIVAEVLADRLYVVPADLRVCVEQALLAWAMDQEGDTWDVNPDSGEILVFNLRWKKTDLSLDVLAVVLGNLVNLLHARLTTGNGDAGHWLRCIDWCVLAAKELPPNQPALSPALRLIADGKVPKSVADGAKVLKDGVANSEALDDAVLAQFGLPLWPYLTASRENGKITLANMGIGVARAVRAMPSGTLFSSAASSPQSDLVPGSTIEVAVTGSPAALDVHFLKYGADRCIQVPITDIPQAASESSGAVSDLPFTIDETAFTVTMDDKTAKFSGRGKLLFALIARICRRPGHRVDFATLRNKDDVWNGSPVEDDTIRGAVKRLRDKLAADGMKQLADCIVTGTFQARPHVILDLQRSSEGKSN